MKLLITCSAILIGTVLSLPASADTFRCGGTIIEAGMSQDEVLEHCGSPDERNQQTHNYWVYHRGSGQLNVSVYFYANGNVERIESAQD
jgi:hypothetical protein